MIPHRAFYPTFAAEWLARLLAIISLVAALVLVGYDASRDNTELIQELGKSVQDDFLAEVKRLKATPPEQLASPFNPTLNRSKGNPDIVGLKLSTNGELLSWSSQEFIPSDVVLAGQLGEPRDEILVDNSLVYYNLKTVTDTAVYFCLIPLKVSFPIQNEYLSDFVYLGHYNSRGLEIFQPARSFSLLPVRQEPIKGNSSIGINILDPEQRHLFSIRILDTMPLRRPVRMAALFAFIGLILFGGWFLYHQLRRKVRNPWVREAIFLGGLVTVRLLLLYFRLPASFVTVEFFSSSLLAVNELNPSLGDLTLNAVLLLIFSLRFYLLAQHENLGRFVSERGRLGWWLFHLGAVGIAAVLYSAFFKFFELLAINSKTYFEFADLYRLDAYSYLLFLNVALILLTILVLLYYLAGISQQIRGPYTRLWAPLMVLGFGAMLVSLLYGASLLDPLAFVGFVLLTFLLRLRNGPKLTFGLVNSLILIAGLAALTNFAITKSLRLATYSNLQHYSAKYADQKDWLSEYIFDEVANNIAEDRNIWRARPITAKDTSRLISELPGKIINQYLANNFRGYDYYVFVFDSTGKRLDPLTEPYPNRLPGGISSQAYQTLSTTLYFVPSNRNTSRNIYLGRFKVPSTIFGDVGVQIELHPKTSVAGQLYPELLVDQSIRQKMGIPPDYQVAFYRGRHLERREGDFSFPTLLTQPVPPNASVFKESGDSYEYYLRLDNDQMVYGRANKRTLFDRITAFSFLYYFYVLLYGLYSLPGLLRRITAVGFSTYSRSFTYRIQFFMAVVSFVPLLVLWLLISPQFGKLYYQDAETGLRKSLQQVSDYLAGESPYVRSLAGQVLSLPSSSEVVNRASNLLSTDINVFNLRGELHTTSRPKLYQISLSSRFMNPTAYQALASGKQSEIILREKTGKLSYLSGYIALMDGSGQVRGFLNLPYLSQQGLLENQVRSFAAYLINLYVIIMLGIIVGGLFISKSLTNPLTLLKQKLDQTNLGMTYERLEWQSKDEIGSIISSYNQMLQKLESSEKKLARNERELAWREMARQVAHEIKNPLTPMKLSIQHLMRMLQRTGQDRDPAMHKVTGTLLAQIESLNSIASSFSMFATMPHEKHTLVELQNVVGHACELYLDAEEAELSFEMPEIPCYVQGDKDQLSRILINLIRNALQAMDHRGSVHVRLYEEGTRAVVTVQDTGKGIPIDIQSRIFEPNFSTKNSGMGLGLAITKRLVENMEGTITFESEVGVGTTFYISFPIMLPEPEIAAELVA